MDLIILDMLDVDIIFDMDWLSPYHAIFYYFSKIVTLATLDVARLSWKGTPSLSIKGLYLFDVLSV